MEIFKIKKSKQTEVNKLLEKDDIFRLSITIKDGSIIGKDDCYILILEGLKERLDIARKEIEPFSEISSNEEKEKIKAMIEKEREDVLTGMGSIFG